MYKFLIPLDVIVNDTSGNAQTFLVNDAIRLYPVLYQNKTHWKAQLSLQAHCILHTKGSIELLPTIEIDGIVIDCCEWTVLCLWYRPTVSNLCDFLIEFLHPKMIHFDAVDFSEHCSKEEMFLLMLIIV